MANKASSDNYKTALVLLGIPVTIFLLFGALFPRRLAKYWATLTKLSPRVLKKYKITVKASATRVDDSRVNWGAEAWVYQGLPISPPFVTKVWIPAEAHKIDLKGDISLFATEGPIDPDSFVFECSNTTDCHYSLISTDYIGIIWDQGLDIYVEGTAEIGSPRDPFLSRTISNTDEIHY